MKTVSIILSILLILSLGYIIFKPNEPTPSELKIIDQRDGLLLENKRLQSVYDLKSMHVDKLKAELLESKAQVKRSEEKLVDMKARESVHLKQIKRLSLSMSEAQADSAIEARFKSDPDSIRQKVFVDLERLDACDSIQKRLEDFSKKMRASGFLSDSVMLTDSSLLTTSRSQLKIVGTAVNKDQEIIDSKDKEIKKLKRRNRMLKIAVPVAVVLTVILL